MKGVNAKREINKTGGDGQLREEEGSIGEKYG